MSTVRGVLTSFDDYPIHPGSVPIALTNTADPNHYDRYFFNGYGADGSLYFALAMGLYPNRHVADAAISVVRNRQQVNVRASRRAPGDRADATRVGPVEVRVVEPLRTLQVLVDAPEHGVRADLTFAHRSDAIEEPHFLQRAGQRVVFDYTRLTQFGRWTGWLELDGERIEVAPGDVVGSRDRSWGVRPVGERAPVGAPTGAPQFYWLWAPVSFDTYCTHADVNEYADGRRWHEGASVIADGSAPDTCRALDYRIEWRPGTRAAAWCELDLLGFDDTVRTVRLEPLYEFQMLGIGYGHPEWGHGMWRGELATAGDRWSLPVPDPTAPHHVHVQALCRATCGDDEGVGILEQLVVGPHAPTGLTGIFDGYAPG
jgi:hypothetical protein